MKQSKNLLDSQLEPWFSSLRAVPPRDQQAIRRGRNEFLAQAGALTLPVSKLDNRRHTEWKNSFSKFIHFKEYSPMYATVASFILILALMFGGTGATVLAAQGSLPNQSLYQVKTFAEDLVLRSTLRNTDRLQMELDYAERRLTEMTRLHTMEQAVPEATQQRFEMHLDQALRIAAQSEESEMIRMLNQIRERLQDQIASLPQDVDHDPLMTRLRETIQTRLSWTDLGLEEPLQFRMQAQVRTQFEQEPQFDQGYGPGPVSESEPAEQGFGPGPQEAAPGDGECQFESCEPAAKNSVGPGPQAEEGQTHTDPGPEQSSSGEEHPGPGSSSTQDSETVKKDHSNNMNLDPGIGTCTKKGGGCKP